MKFAEELCQAYVTDGTLFDQRAADIDVYKRQVITASADISEKSIAACTSSD